MIRARSTLRAALWWAALASALLWWTPSILLAVVAWQGGRLRFALAIGLGRSLVAVGLRSAARRVYGEEHRRAERCMRALRGRRGW